MIPLTKIRDIIAITACKLLTCIGRLMGKMSTSAPGGFALKISPSLLKRLSSKLKGPVIMVCGTNGKTTTNNLLYSLLTSRSNRVVCNNIGANMLPGVASSFIMKTTLFGKLKADCASLECDEASLRRIVPFVKPDYIIVTNLFRDQLDRYGEIDTTISMLNEAFDMAKDATLILNGDDPLSERISKGRKVIYYGVNESCNPQVQETKEGRFCPVCQTELSYNYYHYSQLGDYLCENCGFKRPRLDWSVTKVDMTDGLKFDVTHLNKTISLNLNYRGFYNIYNIVSALIAFSECGNSLDGVTEVFNSYKPQIARMEPFEINGKTVILNLAKNPAGFNQAIATISLDKRPKDIVIAINDAAGDGKDVSWLWDVDFEKLSSVNLTSLTASGIRKYEIALRLKYANLCVSDVLDNNIEMLKKVLASNGEVCYVLVNYTAMFSAHDNLKSLSEKEEGRK